MAGAPSYRGAWRSSDFRLLAAALTQSALGDWAYNVALVVYVYQHTHSATWVSAATLCRMVPALVGSPYGGVLAERFERVRLMISADLLRAVLMAGMAALTAADAPAWTVLLLAGCCALVATVYNPATAAMTPQLLGEEHLAAGNAIVEAINNVTVIVGPALGVVVLALGSASTVLAIDTVTFLVSAVLLTQLRARSTPTDVTAEGGPLRQVGVGVRAVFGSRTAVLLTSIPVLTTFLYGVDTVLFVYLSQDRLGTGATGYGYLLVGLGVGGLIATAFVNRLAALPQLSAVLAVGVVAYAAPTALLLLTHSPALAFAVETVRGVATVVVDVLAMTALQRSLPPQLVSRVFGVFFALILGGLSLGALVTPALLAGVGLSATLWLDALVVPAVVAALYPPLRALDRLTQPDVAALAPRVAILQKLELFSSATHPALERLARAATEVALPTGTVLLRQGEPADALYVLVEGTLTVTITARDRFDRSDGEDRHLRDVTAPAYVGEIGVLQRSARTATVTIDQPSLLWRIDGAEFLDALTDLPLSAAALSTVSLRLQRTQAHHATSATPHGDPEGMISDSPTQPA